MLCEQPAINVDEFVKFAMSIGRSCIGKAPGTFYNLPTTSQLTTEEVLNTWNMTAPFWASVEKEKCYRRNMATIARQLSKIKDDEKWLSLGCGPGLYEIWLSMTLGVKIHATDLSPEMIKVATEIKDNYLAEDIKFSQMSMESIFHPKESFDRILSINAFHWVLSWQKAIAEIGRVIKDDGELYLISYLKPTEGNYSDNLVASMTGAELFDEFERNGLEITLTEILEIYKDESGDKSPHIFINAKKTSRRFTSWRISNPQWFHNLA